MGKLTVVGLRALVKPGRYGDGKGLHLHVRDAGRRAWVLRYMRDGKTRDMGLGPYPDVSLAEARDKAEEARRLIRAGADPLQQREEATLARKAAAAQAITFQDVAGRYVAAHEGTWRNAKHRWQWGATLEAHAFPVIGALSVAAMDTGAVMRVLEPIWREKPETASRLRGRLELVLDYAAARGWRTGENPARWRGHLANLLPKPGKLRAVEHHAALPWGEVGAFMAELREQTGTAARCLELVILTAARTGEAIGARWVELDLMAGMWTVPRERMKVGAEHRVPLSRATLAVLEAQRAGAGEGEYVFPGARAGRPLSNMAMAMLLRRMRGDGITVHGFRSAFRDWTAESTAYPREVAEAALAHTLRDKVEAAYRRGDLFEKRRRLMEEWATFCADPTPRGQVVPIADGRRVLEE